MPDCNVYRYLAPGPDSLHTKVLAHSLRAEILYGETVGPDPLTPEEVARDYDVPVEAVLEAIHYCTENKELLEQDRQRLLESCVSKGVPSIPQGPAYKHLAPKRGSSYRQFYVDQRMRAETLYREIMGLNRHTPEEVVSQWNVPLEAVYEAVHYCEHNQALLDEERARE